MGGTLGYADGRYGLVALFQTRHLCFSLGYWPRAFALVMTARVLSRWTVMVVLLQGFFFFFLFTFAVNWGEAPSTLIFFADAGMIG